MHIRFPSKASVFCAFKIIGGSAAVLASILDGTNYGGCPPGTLCAAPLFDFYAVQLDFLSVGTILLAFGLLLSAFKDLLLGLPKLELLERNIEVVAGSIDEIQFLTVGRNDPIYYPKYDYQFGHSDFYSG